MNAGCLEIALHDTHSINNALGKCLSTDYWSLVDEFLSKCDCIFAGQNLAFYLLFAQTQLV
jgi:hypothetical protein